MAIGRRTKDTRGVKPDDLDSQSHAREQKAATTTQQTRNARERAIANTFAIEHNS